ncbi:hypothetical protein JV499_004747 [Escherichia coli]|nr:hypothetical protein [Escherichia coli]
MAVMPLAAKVLKRVKFIPQGIQQQVPAKRQNRGSRNSTGDVLQKSGFISGSGNTHLFVLSVIRLAGNENAGTEGGKHRKASDADMKKAGQGPA